MKPPRTATATLSHWIHAPVNSSVAFFAIAAACMVAIFALRSSFSAREGNPLLRPGAVVDAKSREVPLPPEQSTTMVVMDSNGMPITLGEYYVGVYVESVDPVLLAQLKIDRGLVVRHVVPGSPAEAAGVKPNDLMISAGEAPLKVVCDLGIAISKTGTVETAFEFLRAGEPLKLAMTPTKRPSKMWTPPEVETASIVGTGENQTAGQWVYANPSGVAAKVTDSGENSGKSGRGGSETVSRDATRSAQSVEALRIAALEKELAKAQEELKSLKEELAKKDARQTERQ